MNAIIEVINAVTSCSTDPKEWAKYLRALSAIADKSTDMVENEVLMDLYDRKVEAAYRVFDENDLAIFFDNL